MKFGYKNLGVEPSDNIAMRTEENKNHNSTIIIECEADRNMEYIFELRFFPMATYFLSKSASRGAGQSYNNNQCEYRVLEKVKIKEHNS